MHKAFLKSMAACESTLRPGFMIGEIFDAYERTCDKAWMRNYRMNATGYIMGATFLPNWMDWPMFINGSKILIEMNMFFYIYFN